MKPVADISCEEALRQLADYLSGELEKGAGAQLEHHMEACRGCFSRAEFEKRLKSHLAGLSREKAPAAMETRIRGMLRRF